LNGEGLDDEAKRHGFKPRRSSAMNIFQGFIQKFYKNTSIENNTRKRYNGLRFIKPGILSGYWIFQGGVIHEYRPG
jgi:hypothetical protein